MIHGQFLRIALIVLGLLSGCPGLALADLAPDFPTDFAARIPEPGTLILLASGLAALGGIDWLRRGKK